MSVAPCVPTTYNVASRCRFFSPSLLRLNEALKDVRRLEPKPSQYQYSILVCCLTNVIVRVVRLFLVHGCDLSLTYFGFQQPLLRQSAHLCYNFSGYNNVSLAGAAPVASLKCVVLRQMYRQRGCQMILLLLLTGTPFCHHSLAF